MCVCVRASKETASENINKPNIFAHVCIYIMDALMIPLFLLAYIRAHTHTVSLYTYIVYVY